MLVACLSGCVPSPEPQAPVRPPAVSGTSLLIDLTPTNRPKLVGNLDFELLPKGSGFACVTRGSGKEYWVGMAEIASISSDWLTSQAIAAAVTDAVSRLEDVDSILLTSIVTEAKGAGRVCATISGRGVRLMKSTESDEQGSAQEHLPSGEN